MSCNIELEVGAGSNVDEFTIQVVHSAAGGEPSATMHLDVDGLLRDRDALESTVLASAVTGRRIASPGEQQLQQVGRQLFEALFSGPVYGAYRASLGAAQQQGERLRVVLRLTAPRLAALPWEALFDPETGTHICRKEPLVRHIPAPYTPEPLKVVPPLRVLGLVASPRGLPALDVAAEQAHLSQALAGPIAEGLIELVWLAEASWDSVQEKLLSEHWHVLHFIGHGDYDPTTDQGLIALVGQDGRANLVGAERLADLLNEAQPTPRLVVLNSCSSGEQGTQDLFSGTAAGLVRSGISAVAAMQFTISDTAAIAFAKGFYTAIAHGHTIDDATRSGRISILGAGGTLEWVTPVLYVRGDTTELFDVTQRALPPVRRAVPPQTKGPRRPAGRQAVGRRMVGVRRRLLTRGRLILRLVAASVLVAVGVSAGVYLYGRWKFSDEWRGFDSDKYGFLYEYDGRNDWARCNDDPKGVEHAAVMARTGDSLMVICHGTETGSYYFLRIFGLEDKKEMTADKTKRSGDVFTAIFEKANEIYVVNPKAKTLRITKIGDRPGPEQPLKVKYDETK